MGRNIKKNFFETISTKKGHTFGFLDIEAEDLKPRDMYHQKYKK